MICPICGSEYENNCHKCMLKLEHCMICFDKFEIGDNILQCPECMHFGHLNHMMDWIYIKNTCPVCRSKIKVSEYHRLKIEKNTIKEQYIHISDIFRHREEIFNDFQFRYEFYDFQNKLVNNLVKSFEHQDRFLLISPPGSGKTIIALALAGKLGVHTLVITPNLAVLGSWIDRAQMFFEPIDADIKVNDVIGKERGGLRPISVTTYSRISNEINKLNQKNTEVKKPKKDKYEKKLDIKGLEKFEKNFKYAGEVDFIYRLRDYNVQFLILDEAHKLTKNWGDKILELINYFPNIKILGLTATPPIKEDIEFNELFGKNNIQIPLPQLVRERILVPYRDLIMVYPEKRVLQELSSIDSDDIYYKLIRNAIREFEYIKKHKNKDCKTLSKYSSLKLAMTIDIIKKEYKLLGDSLRVLVITDFENLPKKYNLKLKGMQGSIGVFRSLVLDPVIDELQPVMITGKSILIDDDYADSFIESALKWAEDRGLNIKLSKRNVRKGKYTIINGSGKDWSVDLYTRVITYLFDTGKIRLIVGTRHLFGEGWDSISLNTIIDLTGSSTYATVNQIRGRALRHNPNLENKVSNIWEFIPNPKLTPYFESEYQQLNKKYNNYFGIDNIGGIRNGLNRVNPLLLSSKINGKVEQINNISLELGKNRDECHRLWRVGEDLGELYVAFNITINDSKLYLFSDSFSHALRYVFWKIIEHENMDTRVFVIYRHNKDSISFSVLIETNRDYDQNILRDKFDENCNSGYLIKIEYIPATNYTYINGVWVPEKTYNQSFFIPYAGITEKTNSNEEKFNINNSHIDKAIEITNHTTISCIKSRKLMETNNKNDNWKTVNLNLGFEYVNQKIIDSIKINNINNFDEIETIISNIQRDEDYRINEDINRSIIYKNGIGYIDFRLNIPELDVIKLGKTFLKIVKVATNCSCSWIQSKIIDGNTLSVIISVTPNSKNNIEDILENFVNNMKQEYKIIIKRKKGIISKIIRKFKKSNIAEQIIIIDSPILRKIKIRTKLDTRVINKNNYQFYQYIVNEIKHIYIRKIMIKP